MKILCQREILVPKPPHAESLILVIATKIALQDISPVTIVWLRFAMGVIVLGLAVALRNQFALPQKNEWPEV